MDDKALKKAVSKSGFPLQIAIEHLVETIMPSSWKVLSKEHAWNNGNTDGFIDLVLQKADRLRMVIECKKVFNAQWIFLNPDSVQGARNHFKAWVTRAEPGKEIYFGWADLTGQPISGESEFCVMVGNNKRTPLLEWQAGELIQATEGVATEEYYLWKSNPERGSLFNVYINVIVTTADLYVYSFSEAKISLKDGNIDSTNFFSVPYVRFRKQLSTSPASARGLLASGRLEFEKNPNFRTLVQAKENTVFIVNSLAFQRFLGEFREDDRHEKEYYWPWPNEK